MGHDVLRLRHGHANRAIAASKGQGLQPLGGVLVQQGDHLGLRSVGGDIDEGDAQLLGQSLVDRLPLHEAEVNEDLTDELCALFLGFQCLVELVLRNQAPLNQHLTDEFAPASAHVAAPRGNSLTSR